MKPGWSLHEDEDWEPGENRKLTYWLIGPDGRRHLLDVSPYERDVPPDVVDMMIDMGVPQRDDFGSIGPVSVGMIRARHRNWTDRAQRAVA